MVLDAIFQGGKRGGRFRQRDLVVISDVLKLRVFGRGLNVGHRCIVLDLHDTALDLYRTNTRVNESERFSVSSTSIAVYKIL